MALENKMVRKRDSSKPERNSQRPSLYAILVLQHQGRV